MNCKECNNLIREYVSGELDSFQLEQLKEHIKLCADCRNLYNDLVMINSAFDSMPELEPPDEDPVNFRKVIDNEVIGQSRKRNLTVPWYIYVPVSIAASLMIFYGGYHLGNRDSSPLTDHDELAELKKEMTETKNLMILTLLSQQSASKRIQAANYAAELDELEPEVMKGLLNSLSHDNSTNVRLATLETLARYSGDPVVRMELVNAFGNQDDPVIQINMINLMVMINEKSSAGALLKLVEDESTSPIVKEQAEKGLEVLL